MEPGEEIHDGGGEGENTPGRKRDDPDFLFIYLFF